jgi:hypothetical protein
MTIATIAATVPAGLVSAPPRCNFAGFCIYCGLHGCTDPACVAEYAASSWAVCPACEGRGGDGISTTCRLCLHGVTEALPSHPGAVRAVTS